MTGWQGRLTGAALLAWFASVRLLAGAAVVLQTDFGVKDGAVAAMKGVAYGVDPALAAFDLTHEIPAFDVWQAGYRLQQTVPFWPAGTVFVSVVDPGVGTDRLPVVARTRAGHFVVTPDNGTLTFLAETPGLDAVRVIDTRRHLRPGSEASHTFHGRDLFVYVAARLASGQIRFDDVGPLATAPPVLLARQAPALINGAAVGGIPVLDPQFGNVWSDVPKALADRWGLKPGDRLEFRIWRGGRLKARGVAPFASTFGAVPKGQPLVYLNSLLNLSLALNQGNFAARHHIESGPEWTIRFSRILP